MSDSISNENTAGGDNTDQNNQLDSLQAENDKLKQELAALSNNKNEILGEKKNLQKSFQEYQQKTGNQLEQTKQTAETENQKLLSQMAQLTETVENLKTEKEQERAEKEKFKLSDQVKSALTKSGVISTGVDLLSTSIMGKLSKDENGDFFGIVDGKTVNAAEYAAAEAKKYPQLIAAQIKRGSGSHPARGRANIDDIRKEHGTVGALAAIRAEQEGN